MTENIEDKRIPNTICAGPVETSTAAPAPAKRGRPRIHPVAGDVAEDSAAEPAEKPKYVFPKYSVLGQTNAPPFAAGFDRDGSGLSFKWFLFRKRPDAERDYWQAVQKDTHPKMMRPDAWDHLGLVSVGRTNDGNPLKILMVRPKEASEAEAVALEEAGESLRRKVTEETLPKEQDGVKPRASSTITRGRWRDMTQG